MFLNTVAFFWCIYFCLLRRLAPWGATQGQIYSSASTKSTIVTFVTERFRFQLQWPESDKWVYKILYANQNYSNLHTFVWEIQELWDSCMYYPKNVPVKRMQTKLSFLTAGCKGWKEGDRIPTHTQLPVGYSMFNHG